MNNKYTLGSIVLGILLMAILGVNRAMSWLNNSTANEQEDARIVAIDADELDSDEVRGRSSTAGNNRLNQASDRAQNRFEDQTISQADGISGASDGTDIALLPLEEAGTFIQRQKRVEEDKVVTNTRVDVIPVASSNVAAQTDTITPQPPATETTPSNAEPSATRPASNNTAPAVPALW